MEQIRISSKNLGQLALEDFCPRCFWVKLKCGGKLPFQSMPGIFSSLDSYTKKVTRAYHERHGKLSHWFDGFGDLGQPIPVPHHTKFRIIDETTNILLTGVPDDIFQRPDRQLFVVDYKSAKWNDNQQRMLPMYETQLNSYAYIAERIGMGAVSGLGLIYNQPQSELDADNIDCLQEFTGSCVRFDCCALKCEPSQTANGRAV